jgi:influenza virus NS1A-binding protein
MLFLALDNSLQDVSDLIGEKANSDLVKDYKKLASKNPGNTSKPRRKGVSQPERPRILLYSRDISDRTYDDETRADADWNVVASTKLSDHTYVSLVTLNGALCRISIKLRLNSTVSTTEPQLSGTTTPSPIPTERSNSFDGKDAFEQQKVLQSQIEPPELFCEVATMSESKCGLGAAEHEGKLIVVGGYGRTECLKSVESYCPITNKWTEELSLNEARGRVQVSIIDNVIYAVGGSNGVNELDTVECLALSKEEVKKKWKKCAKLPFPRSNAGVCALGNKIYCIGGNSTGQNGIRQCDVFDPETNKWSSIAPLNTGRCQAGVVAFNGKLWAAGGSDAWNCLTTVEVYDPEEDSWVFIAPLLTARRGCGLAELNGKVICIGGSDGSQSLKTTEYYDDATQSWILGPSLITARSNVSVAVINNRLYAVGGFSGKKFLNTIEYFDEEANEWSKFAKLQPITHQNIADSCASSTSSNGYNSNGECESKNDSETDSIDLNEHLIRGLKQKVSFKLNDASEKDKIREDESESTTVIMPLS